MERKTKERSIVPTAQRLRHVRRELHLSQVVFGKPLGLAQAKMSALEKKDELTRVIALAIEHIYGVQAEWLLTGKGPRYTADGPRLCGGSEDSTFDALLLKRPDIMDALSAMLDTAAPTVQQKKRRKVR